MSKKAIILFHPTITNQYYKCIPYALLYLERMIRDIDVDIFIIDENVEPDYEKKVRDVAGRILFVGISSIIGSQITGGVKFAKFIKSINPQITVLWGGWHSTILPEQTLKEPYIDYIITGQAEESFKEFTETVLAGQSPVNIKNLCYKEGEHIHINPEGDFCDYNVYPPINYTLVDINQYLYYPSYAEKSIVYFASHGCPYNCNFCAMATYYKQKWIPRHIETIIRDLTYFKEQAGIDSVFFQDDNFFTNKTFSLNLCQALIDSGLNLQWETWTHAGGFIKMFNDEEVTLLYKAGCRQIISGSESGSQEVLDAVNKKLDVEDNITFVRLLKKNGITPFFSIMLCFPENPVQELEATFEMIRKAKLIDNTLKIYFSFYTPYPGTKMYDDATSQGFKTPDHLEGWAGHTFDDFHGPWWTTAYSNKLSLYADFYIPLSNPENYRNFYRPPLIKAILFCINKFFYPIVMYRFRKANFNYPIEAKTFLFLLNIFNKVFNKSYKLYPF